MIQKEKNKKNLEQERERERVMYSVRVTFHSGSREYRTIRQTQVRDRFIWLTQLSANSSL